MLNLFKEELATQLVQITNLSRLMDLLLVNPYHTLEIIQLNDLNLKAVKITQHINLMIREVNNIHTIMMGDSNNIDLKYGAGSTGANLLNRVLHPLVDPVK
jgi:hypothetical protein